MRADDNCSDLLCVCVVSAAVWLHVLGCSFLPVCGSNLIEIDVFILPDWTSLMGWKKMNFQREKIDDFGFYSFFFSVISGTRYTRSAGDDSIREPYMVQFSFKFCGATIAHTHGAAVPFGVNNTLKSINWRSRNVWAGVRNAKAWKQMWKRLITASTKIQNIM